MINGNINQALQEAQVKPPCACELSNDASTSSPAAAVKNNTGSCAWKSMKSCNILTTAWLSEPHHTSATRHADAHALTLCLRT